MSFIEIGSNACTWEKYLWFISKEETLEPYIHVKQQYFQA